MNYQTVVSSNEKVFVIDDSCVNLNIECIQIGNVMIHKFRNNPNQGRVYSTYGLCPTLTDMQGGDGNQWLL